MASARPGAFKALFSLPVNRPSFNHLVTRLPVTYLLVFATSLPVITHAKHALAALEDHSANAQAQVDLFALPPPGAVPEPSPVDQALAAIDPDAFSPRDALEALYRLKKLSGATLN